MIGWGDWGGRRTVLTWWAWANSSCPACLRRRPSAVSGGSCFSAVLVCWNSSEKGKYCSGSGFYWKIVIMTVSPSSVNPSILQLSISLIVDIGRTRIFWDPPAQHLLEMTGSVYVSENSLSLKLRNVNIKILVNMTLVKMLCKVGERMSKKTIECAV